MAAAEIKRYDNGKESTACAGTVLRALGVTNYHYTWNGTRNVWIDVLRRNGYAVRSRTSRLPKKCTVGKLRKIVRDKLIYTCDTYSVTFAVSVKGHVLLLGNKGQTLVDTSPRKRDRRQVVGVWAVWKKR
jgi:hypothetical protein